MGLTDVKHVILVLSGKGGVGKSSVAVHLALCFQNFGFKTGLLDIDLCGPSIPHMLNLEDKDVHKCSEGWMPVFADDTQNLSVMSIGFLLKNRDAAVVWRGPKKNAMIKQFLSDVHWQGIDYLVVDMPPGTTDEHITLVENIGQVSHIGAVLVTTPQVISVNDVRREVTFCQKAGITALGVIENMSGFVCPTCQECTAVFSKGGGEALASEMNISFLGSIPLDPNIMEYIDKRSVFLDNWKSATLQTIREITEAIVKRVA